MRIHPTSSLVHSVLATLVTLVILGTVLAQGADLRRLSAALGVAVFALLIWRTVSTWEVLTLLERYLAIALALSPLLAAIAQQALVMSAPDGSLPDNPWLWALVAHRIGCIVIVMMWPYLLGRRHRHAGTAPLAAAHRDDVPWAA